MLVAASLIVAAAAARADDAGVIAALDACLARLPAPSGATSARASAAVADDTLGGRAGGGRAGGAGSAAGGDQPPGDDAAQTRPGAGRAPAVSLADFCPDALAASGGVTLGGRALYEFDLTVARWSQLRDRLAARQASAPDLPPAPALTDALAAVDIEPLDSTARDDLRQLRTALHLREWLRRALGDGSAISDWIDSLPSASIEKALLVAYFLLLAGACVALAWLLRGSLRRRALRARPLRRTAGAVPADLREVPLLSADAIARLPISDQPAAYLRRGVELAHRGGLLGGAASLTAAEIARQVDGRRPEVGFVRLARIADRSMYAGRAPDPAGLDACRDVVQALEGSVA